MWPESGCGSELPRETGRDGGARQTCHGEAWGLKSRGLCWRVHDGNVPGLHYDTSLPLSLPESLLSVTIKMENYTLARIGNCFEERRGEIGELKPVVLLTYPPPPPPAPSRHPLSTSLISRSTLIYEIYKYPCAIPHVYPRCVYIYIYILSRGIFTSRWINFASDFRIKRRRYIER